MPKQSDETNRDERRIASRHVYESRINIHFEDNSSASVVGGWARDLSEAGMRAIVAHELQVGALLTIDLTLTKGPHQSIPARVVWREGTSYGFQFITLSALQRHELRQMVAQQPDVGWQDR